MTDPFVRQDEKKLIRRRSNLAGATLLTMNLATVLILVVLVILQFSGVDTAAPYDNANSLLLYQLATYLPFIGLPILIGWAINRSRWGTRQPLLRFERVDPAISLALIMGGMALCLLADLIAALSTGFFALFHLFPSDSPSSIDGTPLNLIGNLLVSAALPALMEETLFRGVVLQTLRPAGDSVAVIVSALVFGLAHGTLTQIPFAFVLGLVFAFITIRTNNIGLAMILHFLNNAMAVLIEYASVSWEESAVVALEYGVFLLLALMGIAAMAVLIIHPARPVYPLGESPSAFSKGKRAGLVLTAPALLIALVLMAFSTLSNIEYDPSRSLADELFTETEGSSEDPSSTANPSGSNAVTVGEWVFSWL